MVLVAYITLAALLACFGVHRWVLLAAWWRSRGPDPRTRPLADPPRVTVQLPLFNERDVAARLIDAVADLDWPAERLHIQVLDDSTDDTPVCTARAIQRARDRGIQVDVLHRTVRTGFKAGALQAGLREGTADLIAIFDADFVPGPDFLRRTIPHFSNPEVGMVQARWGHLNAAASALTQAQAVMLDGHFVIDHAARNRAGLWFNFNGTAGVWRRAAIEAAGGWSHDTLTEDLDLSYRAQLAGWAFLYLPELVVPAELPASVGALRSQQRRWAKGSIETAQKLRARILGARVGWRVKAEALAHLHANLSWPFGLLLAVLLPLVVASTRDTAWHAVVDLPAFLFATLPHLVFYRVARRAPIGWALAAVVLGVGLGVSQTRAVIEGLAGARSEFIRTPKQGAGAGSYRSRRSRTALVELALAAWQSYGVLAAVQAQAWGSIPFLLLFLVGFAWVGLASLVEARGDAAAEPLSALAK